MEPVGLRKLDALICDMARFDFVRGISDGVFFQGIAYSASVTAQA
jgi:hypothetical protein